MKKDEIDLPQRTKQFALMVIRLFGSLPKRTEAQILGAQLLRSGTGAGANYREAHRARSKAEFIAKCGDALRELEESSYWMELLAEGNIVQSEALLQIVQECNELTAIFVTIINRAKRR
ncbi:MAG TPA: four helix bundle protein [Chthoniobacterales bacterium]|nr:four helix bundle protein [Chthoniobacterales bacterium]